MEKPIQLVALAVITLGVPELRDAQGVITREATLRHVQPGEPFAIESEEDATELRVAGHARDPIVAEVPAADTPPAVPQAAKAPRKPRAPKGGAGAAGAEGAGQADGTGESGADGDAGETGETQGEGEEGAGEGQGSAAGTDTDAAGSTDQA